MMAAVLLATATMCMAGDVDQRLTNTANVLQQMAAGPESGIPRNLFQQAQCVVVIPGMTRAAFIAGGAYGAGFAMCRTGAGWSAPDPVQIEGGSIGLQAGAQSTDLVMLMMSQAARDQLVSDKLRFGAGLSAQAGPVGKSARASTASDVLIYSRSNGIFASANVSGSVIHQDGDATKTLYGKATPSVEILRGQVRTPPAAQNLKSVVQQISSTTAG